MWKISLFVLFLSTALCSSYAEEEGQQPHILFILADDYGWSDIGYHDSEISTPNLDKLASNGIKLENYYVQPVCTPSRAAIMTGRYPIRYGLQHGVIQAPQAAGLFLNETTIADKMREAGYATHAIGKWHLGFFQTAYTPTYRGFDTYVGYYAGGEDYYSHNATWVYTGFDFRNNTDNYVAAKGEYSSSVFEKEALRIINDYQSSPPSSRKPIFMYLAMQTCHIPLEVPEEFLANCSQFKDKHRNTYCGMTVNLDLTIGNITAALEEAGMLENTLIVFSTDNGGLPVENGGASNWPLRGGKFTLWEGGVRGVGFISGYGIPTQSQGSIYNGLMHETDWYPTLMHVAGGNTNGSFALDGVDQWDSITSLEASPRSEILHNIDEIAENSALRVGDWKIVVGKQQYSGWYFPPPGSEGYYNIEEPIMIGDNNTVSLFNITADPNEHTDLSSQFPDIVKQMMDKIEEYRQGLVDAWSPPNDPRSNPALFGGNWMPWLDN